MLNGMQKPDQRHRAQTGRHADQRHEHPEARAVARHDPAARNVRLSRYGRHLAQSDGPTGSQDPRRTDGELDGAAGGYIERPEQHTDAERRRKSSTDGSRERRC